MPPNGIPLNRSFSERFPVEITRSFADQVNKFITHYETRGDNPLAFNTALIGVHRAKWLQVDSEFFFTLANASSQDLKEAISQSPYIDPEWGVAGDPFNLLAMWLVHLTLHSKLPAAAKTKLATQLLVLVHYGFFTSIVWNTHKYATDADTMQWALEQLSAKYAIKHPETDTWRKVIYARAADILAPNSIHYKTLWNFAPDKSIGYLLSDPQTRIRRRIVRLNQVYYELKRSGVRLDQRSLTTDVGEGESLLKPTDATFDRMVSGVVGDAIQPDRLIRGSEVSLICRLSNVRGREDMFRSLLFAFSGIAIQQAKEHKYDVVTTGRRKGEVLYQGYRELLTKIITVTFTRHSRTSALDLRNRADLLVATVNLYRSSRVDSIEIDNVKRSVEQMIRDTGISRREATISSLKVAFITYIVFLALDAV